MVKPDKSLKPIQVSEREAAQILGVCEKTLFNLRRARKIAFVRCGSRVAYRLDALDRYSKANETPAAV